MNIQLMRSTSIYKQSDLEQPFQLNNIKSLKQNTFDFNQSQTPQAKSSTNLSKSPLQKIQNLMKGLSERKESKQTQFKPLKECSLKENRKIIEPISIESQIIGFDDEDDILTKKINSSTTRFKDVFENFENKIYSGRRASNSISFIINKETTQEIQKQRKVVKQQQLDELSLLDLKNINLQLQQENMVLKQQIQLQQTQKRHDENIIKKQKITILQLHSFNTQMKTNLENTKQFSSGLEKEITKQKHSVNDLNQQVCTLNLKLQQYSKIEDDIKQIESFYLNLLSNLSREIKIQQVELQKYNSQTTDLHQIIKLLINKEEIPLDLLFKYKQNIKQYDEQPQIQDIVEALQTNTKLIKQMTEELKPFFELVISTQVDEYSKIFLK